MKILLYTQFCTPEPIFKSVPFAKELRQRGHEVRILTSFPNYPGGRLYPGYRIRCRQREEIDGVPILRVPLYPSHGGSIAGRAFNYLSFAATSALPLLAGWKPDVVYIYNLATLGLLAHLNGLLRGVPYVMDVQDLWPDSVFQSGMGRRWMTAPLERLCRIAYQRAARVVTLSPGMAEELVRRGVPSSRVECIYNWCDESVLPRPGVSEGVPGFEGRFNILYAGNLGRAQALESVIDAAAIAGRRDPRIQFVFMGRGVCEQALRARAASVAPASTLFLEGCSQDAAGRVMLQADVLLLHLAPKPLFDLTIPSKTQTYLAMGKPILAAVGRDASHLVESSAAGVGCRSGDPSEIAKVALRLAQSGSKTLAAMGASGRAFYESQLSLSRGVLRWESALRTVVGRI